MIGQYLILGLILGLSLTVLIRRAVRRRPPDECRTCGVCNVCAGRPTHSDEEQPD